jgi:prevent-host-death family protein
MKTLTIREMRSALPHLDEILAEAGEVVVTRRGRPLARIVPMRRQGGIQPLTELRAISPRMKVPSEVLVRQDRDER